MIKSDKILLIVLLSFSLLYFPFVFRYFIGSFYNVIILSCVFVVFFSSLFWEVNKNINKLGLFCVALMLLKPIMTMLGDFNVGGGITGFIAEFVRVIPIIIFILFFKEGSWYYCLSFYSRMVLFFSLIAIFGFFYEVSFGNQFRALEIYIDNSGGLDSGLRGVTFYSLQWMKLPFFSTEVYRLQSFTSEAGNFGLALVPAILYFVIYEGNDRKAWVKIVILLTTMLLTLSISIYAGLLILLFVVFILNSKKKKYIFSLIFVAIIIFFLIYYYHDYIMVYLDSKFNESAVGESSYDQRLTQFDQFLSSVDDCLVIGCGVGAISHLGNTLAIGWLVPVAKYGLFYSTIYYLFFFVSLIFAVKKIKDIRYRYSALILIFFISQGFLRGEPFSSFWYFFFILPLFINCRSSNHEKRHS